MKRFRAQVRANVRTVFRARSLALALGCTIAAGGAIAFRLPAQAQTASTVDIRIVPPETTNGGSLNAGGLLTQVVVFNTGSAPLANVQVVVRVPNAPALVQNVAENGAPLGVIDARTGLWYHTIASLAEGRSFTFVVNWWNPCAGKWPFAVRANDRRVSTSFQFTGASAAAQMKPRRQPLRPFLTCRGLQPRHPPLPPQSSHPPHRRLSSPPQPR
jgi:hypothetical protein